MRRFIVLAFIFGVFSTLIGCASPNRVSPDDSFDAAAAETGIVIFSTTGAGNSTFGTHAESVTARPYNRVSGCVREPNDVREQLSIDGDEMIAEPQKYGDDRTWHVYELLPGDYAITEVRIRRPGYPTTHVYVVRMAGHAPTLTVRAGEVTYAGDFQISTNVVPMAGLALTLDGRGVFATNGHDDEAAAEVLADFPNLPQDFEVVPSTIAPLRCGPGVRTTPPSFPGLPRTPRSEQDMRPIPRGETPTKPQESDAADEAPGEDI